MMKKILLTTLFLLLLNVGSFAQVYSNVFVEVNTLAELTNLIVSAPFVFCRQDNTLYHFDPVLNTFVAYPQSTVVSVNGASGAVVLTTATITDSTNKRYVTDANLTAIGNALVKTNNLSDLSSIATAKTNLALVKADVGLSNVDNTADAAKPVSTAEQTALNLKVDLTKPYGYALNVQALTSSPVDAQTIFFGTLPKAPTTTAGQNQIFIRKAGTIKVAELYCFSGTAGTAEAWAVSIRLNNTTDTLIQSVSTSANIRTFSNTGLNIAVAAGDFIEIKSVNPTWVTNPLTTVFSGYLYIE